MESVSRSSSSLVEGPEYRAMRECNAMMVDLLQFSIGRLGDALFAKQLIPLDVKKNLRSTTQSEENRTREVIEYIISEVKYNPQVFHDFIAVLKEQDLLNVADQLLSCYQFQTATPQASSSLTPSHSQGGKLRLQYSLPEDIPSEVIQALESVTISVLFEDKNQSVIESPLRVDRDNTQPQPHTDTQIPWNTDPKYGHGAIGTGDVLLLVSKVSGVNVVPRRNRPPLTEEEKQKLQEQGIHEDFCYSDLSIMKARHDLDKNYTSAGVLTGEQTTCEEVRQTITELFNTTDKQRVMLHYIGPGQRETGNWCFKDGFISFQEIMEFYTRHQKPRGRILTILSDCSYSGLWVKEAMTFMDGQGVGPCGHQAKEKGILVKVFTSCLANEVPAELAFSTHCAENDKAGTVCYYINHKEIHDNQHTSGLDFTQVGCNNKIDQSCTMAPQSTWQQWSVAQRTYLVRGTDRGRPVWFYVLLKNDEDNIRTFKAKVKTGSLDVADYGEILESGWGKDPPEEIKKKIEDNYHINYNYQPSPDTTD